MGRGYGIMIKKRDVEEMKQTIQKNHDGITRMEPTIKRLEEVFKPDGKFDKFCEITIKNESQLRVHWVLIILILTGLVSIAWSVIKINGGI